MSYNKKEKVVCFAGHRNEWHCIGIEEKLEKTLEELIDKGYTTFLDGGYGAFDKKCLSAVLKLKQKYKQVKIIKVLAYYKPNKEKYELPSFYDGSIYPDLEEVHYKQIITKRNHWMVDQSDILVCHIENTFHSGAYNTLKYAQKQGKPVIYI